MRTSVYLLNWHQTCGIAVSWDFSHGSFQPYWSFFLSVFHLTVHCTTSEEVLGSGFVEDWGRQKLSSPFEPELQKMFQVPVPCDLLQPASLSVCLWHFALGFIVENIALHPWSCLWTAWSPCLQGTPCEWWVSALEEMDKLRNHAQHIGLAFPHTPQQQFQLWSRREDTDSEAQTTPLF